ncbi:Gti1/Pac2 family-domain-containing protein [Favolaschia claudopus]|uniref:Gti1/Pac2 family-domain-containing protein n=1 Tax=Favolaschia claudopus TaxID=2862362 RepID=A0AAW0C273_9AGAR
MGSSQPTDVPPFYGAVETTMNALRLIHAARQGVIPRITRRLNDSERRTMIKSGAVFVFSVEESGIKRWTDGLLWSPSRIVGNFLVYREINERTNSRGSHRKLYPTEDSSRALSSSEHGTFKPNGLIKKTITVTIEGSDLHLISYYTSADQHSGKLKRPTTRPDIMALSMDPRLFRATNFRVPPKVEKGPDGVSRLVETEEIPSETVECKIEEEPYSVSISPTSWGSDSSQGSPVENPFTSNATLFPASSHSSAMYPRTGHSDRWSVPVPTLRPDAWSQSPPSPSYTSRRVESGNQDSWNLSSARWQAETYPPSSPSNSSIYVDRSRSRNTNPYPTPLQIPSRRDSDSSVGMSRYSNHHTGESRDASSRSGWLLSGSDGETKEGIRGHSSSFAAAIGQGQASMYTAQGYHRPMTSHSSYSSGWSSSPSNSLAVGPSQTGAPFSPSSGSIHSYGSSYAPSSGGMSSPEGYSNTDDYGDS